VRLAAADGSDGLQRHLHRCGTRRGQKRISGGHAGYGVPGRYLSTSWEAHSDFLQVMVTAVAELTWRFLPAMEAAGHGRILNVASLAGLAPASAGHTLYGAAKSFAIRFSESLAQETRARGVHVTALCPGFTFSEFHDVAGNREQVSKMPEFMWMTSEIVAQQGYDAVMRNKPVHVNGPVNKGIVLLAKYLPDQVGLMIVRARSKDFRRQ